MRNMKEKKKKDRLTKRTEIVRPLLTENTEYRRSSTQTLDGLRQLHMTNTQTFLPRMHLRTPRTD